MSTIKIGDQMEDGSVYAGRVKGYDVYAAPADIQDSLGRRLPISFNKAVRKVAALNRENYLGHDDWQIPGMDILDEALFKNRNRRNLKATFNASARRGSISDWYWSSSESRGSIKDMRILRFSTGDRGWDPKESVRLSCRPVRLVAVSP
jgi:hypothetical protein